MKKKSEEKGPSAERWLLSYADFITLLMVLFVILYSSSNLDATKSKAIAQSLSEAMGGGKTMIKLGESPVSEETKPNETDDSIPTSSAKEKQESEADQMEKIKKELDQYMQQNGLSGSVTTTITERGLVVSLNDSAFFDSAQATVKPEYEGKIISIASIVNKMNNYMRVEGHTDNVPIKNSIFKSNWDLSVIRATNVADLVISKAGVSPQKIAAVGYGEFRPIADNNTPEGRARNRRVDIVLISSKYNESEKVNN